MNTLDKYTIRRPSVYLIHKLLVQLSFEYFTIGVHVHGKYT